MKRKQNEIINCQLDNLIQKLNNFKKTLQPFGYTPKEYLDQIRFTFTKEPLPTNPDFFMY